MEEIIYSKFSTNRALQFQIETKILQTPGTGARRVRKMALGPDSSYINLMHENYLLLKQKLKGFRFPESRVEGGAFYTDFIEGETLEALIEQAGNREEEKRLVRKFFQCLFVSFDLPFDQTLEVGAYAETLIRTQKTLYSLDLSFFNVLVKGDDLYLIDYEWVDPNSSVAFALYRIYANTKNNRSGTYLRDLEPAVNFVQAQEEEAAFYSTIGAREGFPSQRVFDPLNEIRVLQERASHFEQTVNSMLNSRSWKVTKPLRKAFTLLNPKVQP